MQSWVDPQNFARVCWYGTGIIGTGIHVVPTYRSVRYRYWCTEHTEVSGTGIDVVPNLPKYPVPVLMSYWTYGSVRYRCWRRSELTQVSGTGYTGGIYSRYASVRPVPNAPLFVCCSKGTLWIISWKKKVNNKNASLLEFERRQIICTSLSRLVFVRVWFPASYLGEVAKTNLHFVCANWNRLLVVRNRPRRWYSGHLFVCSCDSSAVQLGFRT